MYIILQIHCAYAQNDGYLKFSKNIKILKTCVRLLRFSNKLPTKQIYSDVEI